MTYDTTMSIAFTVAPLTGQQKRSTMEWLNVGVIVLYLIGMILFGFWGKSRTKNASDYLVAGRRLGPVFYTATMCAVVLGGATLIGGIGLGYQYGLSGVWMVTAIGIGVIALSLVFAPMLQKLKIYTVVQMITLRYGHRSTQSMSIVMFGYTLMLSSVSTGAYASIFVVLFDWDRWLSVIVGGSVVLLYSVIGGMFSITLADFVQFIIMTVGMFFLILPVSYDHAGGWEGLTTRLDAEFFGLGGIGLQSIITYIVVYTFGLLIGQDIWQRVFTARSPGVARWGGLSSGIYVIIYGLAGAIVGMAAAVIMPGIENPDDVFAALSTSVLPHGLAGLALASAIAAMMSTASGALIASSTVARTDVVPLLKDILARKPQNQMSAQEAAETARLNAERSETKEAEINANRVWVLVLGIVSMSLAIMVPNVLAALTIAYAILVGGLLVPILGAMLWRRSTGVGATWATLIGSVTTLCTMGFLEMTAEHRFDGVFANEPIYFGLIASAITFVVVSLAGKPTPDDVWEAWKIRSRYGADALAAQEDAKTPHELNSVVGSGQEEPAPRTASH